MANTSWTKIKDPTVVLADCPFCHGGDTFFMSSPNPPGLQLVHLPDAGVVCPARMEQVCDNIEQGLKWWNDRSKKEAAE